MADDSSFPTEQERCERRMKMAAAKAHATANGRLCKVYGLVSHDVPKVSPHEIPPALPAWQLDFTNEKK